MKNFLNIFILCTMTLFCSWGFGMEENKKETFLNNIQTDVKNVFDDATDDELNLIASGFVKNSNIRNKSVRVVSFFSNYFEKLSNDSVFFTSENLANYLHRVIENSLKNFWTSNFFYTEPKDLDWKAVNVNQIDIIKLFDSRGDNNIKNLLLDYVKEHIVSLIDQDLLQSNLNIFQSHELYKNLINPIRQARAYGLLRKYLYSYKMSAGLEKWYGMSAKLQASVQFNIFRRGIIMENMIAFINAARDVSKHDTTFETFKPFEEQKEKEAKNNNGKNSMIWLETFIYRNLYKNKETKKEKTTELTQYLLNQINHFYSRWWHQYRWYSLAGILGLGVGAIWVVKNQDKFKKVKQTSKEALKEETNIDIGSENIQSSSKIDQQLNLVSEEEIVTLPEVPENTQTLPETVKKSWGNAIGTGLTKTKNFLQELFKQSGSQEAIERRNISPLIGPR